MSIIAAVNENAGFPKIIWLVKLVSLMIEFPAPVPVRTLAPEMDDTVAELGLPLFASTRSH